VGTLKVESARARLHDLNPSIQVEVFNEPFTSANAMRIAESYEIIVDGTDNFPTRYLINDLCVLTSKPDIYGAIYRFDGQASVFFAQQGPCYRCLFPEPPPPGIVPSCADAGVLGILPGTIGTIQATETIKAVLGIGSSLVGRLLLYNALDMSFEYVKLKKNPDCKVCGPHPEITGLIDYFEFCGVPGLDHPETQTAAEWNISALELASRIKRGDKIHLVDVREPHELAISHIAGAQNIPLGILAAHLGELDSAQEIVLFCKTGTRSARALELLLSAGFRKVKNLQGGINSWALEVDHSLPLY
jgi:adenylyltransferase/sulfurtransferase